MEERQQMLSRWPSKSWRIGKLQMQAMVAIWPWMEQLNVMPLWSTTSEGVELSELFLVSVLPNGRTTKLSLELGAERVCAKLIRRQPAAEIKNPISLARVI